MPVLIFLLLISCGIIGVFIAKSAGINPLIGFVVGLIFNLPGIVILLLLGILKKKPS